MLPLSRRSLSYLSVAGFLLAGAGWTMAWKNSRALDDATATSEKDGSARAGKPSRDPRAGKEAALLSDPRSVRLMAIMETLDESAEPGKPNPKFIKAAETTLNDSLFHRRQRDFRLLMEKMRPEDAPAIHAHFKSLERDGRYFPDDYAAFAMRWGQIDGEGAMARWWEHDPADRSHGNLINLMTGWGTADPEKALAWVEANKDQLGGMNAYRPLLVGWISSDPVAATAWLHNQQLDGRQVADCVNGAMLDKLYSDGLEGASEWLAGLPDNTPDLAMAAKIGWLNNTHHMGNLDATRAAAAWSKVGSQSWMGPQDFQRFCESVSRANGGTLDGFVEQLATRWPAKEASAQFERWAGEDPAAVGSVLAGMPASELRSAGTEGMIRKLEQTDPAQAETWRKQLAE